MPKQVRARVRTRTVRPQPQTVLARPHPGTMDVLVERRHMGRVTDTLADTVETISVPRFEGYTARVRVEGSVTRNMGDFNSVRVACAIEMPCYPTLEEVDRCYQWCSDKVDEKVLNELTIATTTEAPGDQNTNQNQG